MKILEELLIDMQMKPAVVNVLIDYTLKTNNNKLVKAYIETIAGQWKRNGIETASEAMDLAIKEQSKKCKVSKSTSKKKECVTPEWFNENIKSKNNDTEEDIEFQSILEEFRK